MTNLKKVNAFFRTAIKAEVEEIQENLLLSARQERIFHMYYIKKQDVNFIADQLSVCSFVVNHELRIIREKLLKLI